MKNHIHIFSGRMGFLKPISAGTRHIEDLIDSLKGQDADHHDWKHGDRVAKEIIATYEKGDRVIFIGHSEGCKTAVEVSRTLDSRNIPVKLICGIDPTLNTIPFMPQNVKVVWEFRATSGLVALIRRLTGGRKGVFRFPVPWYGLRYTHTEKGSHVGISKDTDLHALIMAAVAKAVV